MKFSGLSVLCALPTLISCNLAQSEVSSRCSSKSFEFPTLFGAEPLQITAREAYNYTKFSLAPGTDEFGPFTIDFCNVTVTYTHPGWNDSINVQVWLPLKSWTGRLQALGGGGYSASLGAVYLTQAVAKGYAAIGTDSGHQAGLETAQNPESWALTSPGNVNLYLFEDFASRTLHELAVIGKSITREFYGTEPSYSYFNGCSQGGRQALVAAQVYPSDFDGILASAPAINVETFIPAAVWAQQTMKNLDYWPSKCEVNAFTRAAVEACDMLDGVKDGIISNPKLCNFRASSVVGREYYCDGKEDPRRLSAEGAQVVEAAWQGPHDQARNVGWYGLNKDALLTDSYIKTICPSNRTCTADPADLLSSWIKYFLAKDPKFNLTAMSDEDFFSYLKQSKREYSSIAGTDDPDLSGFRQAGGKLIMWHGLADEKIPPNGTFKYYQRVREMDPTTGTFFRAFEAPGVGHCFGGKGAIPNRAFDQLIAWVENNTIPETLVAVNSKGHTRNLCPYPYQQVYIGGNSSDANSFECQGSTFSWSHDEVANQRSLQS